MARRITSIHGTTNPQPEQEGECNHYFAQDGICIYCHAHLAASGGGEDETCQHGRPLHQDCFICDEASASQAASGGGEERRQGHSKLVYNKQTRTIDTVDPHPSPQGNDIDGLIERLLIRHEECYGFPLYKEAADALAAQQQRYQDEHEIVDRVWKALGITTYEGANGKAIYEIVAEQKAALAAAEKEAKHQGEIWRGNGPCAYCGTLYGEPHYPSCDRPSVYRNAPLAASGGGESGKPVKFPDNPDRGEEFSYICPISGCSWVTYRYIDFGDGFGPFWLMVRYE